MAHQRTVKSTITLDGVGLHSGKNVHMTIKPAEEYTGIVFHRTDVSAGAGAINVCADAVKDTMLCTQLKNDHGVEVNTVEHLMATFYALGIDNAIVELDGPEVPILDGSSQPFVKAIDAVGTMPQDDTRKCIKVLKEVKVVEGNSVVSVKPSGEFSLHVFVHFGAEVPPQSEDFCGDEFEFRARVCAARTFCMERDITYMQENGLIKGGSLENAIVMKDGGEILTPGGLRFEDEIICHKALDAMGDLYMAGYRIIGAFNLTRPGHEMNNRLLRAILENKDNWKWVSA